MKGKNAVGVIIRRGVDAWKKAQKYLLRIRYGAEHNLEQAFKFFLQG